MEQFVLGIFQEHLSKFIVGFRKEQVNANLLNGKGEITDVSLNCAFLNQALAKVTPFIELESVHLSKLSFHVTAWSNLKKAPIVVVVEDVKATIVEPLGCLHSSKRRAPRQISRQELAMLMEQGLQKLRGSYGLFDRIVDNSTVEIRTLEVTFQPRGKFKTKRVGPWTPPMIMVNLKHVKYVSVDEFGQEGTPEQVWQHNGQAHKVPFDRRTYMMYKKLSAIASIGLDTLEPLIKEAQVEIHFAFRIRLRDAAKLAIQVDATLQKVEIQVNVNAIPRLAHAVAGLKYCLSKDRSFEDPLVTESSEEAKNEDTEEFSDVDKQTTREEVQVEDEEDEMEGDDASESLSEGDETSSEDDEKPEPLVKQPSFTSLRDQPAYIRRPVILLPNGLVIHDRLSLSLSVHQCTIRGTYSEEVDGHVQLVVKGFVSEVMWPKVSGDKGGYVQASLSYMSLQERFGQRVRSILLGGIQHDIHKLRIWLPGKPRPEKRADESFPLFEDRSIRPDPFGLRHTFPEQAFGLKMTVNYIEKVSNPDEEEIMVVHEIGIDQFDVLMDSDAWCRVLHFLLNDEGNGFDARWHSGDWSDELTTDMLINPTHPLNLYDHLQPTKELFLDENAMVSSDLMNVTARFMNMEVRVPAAIREDVRSCDIIIAVSETMLVVSSALPRTFLTGKIGASIHGDGSRKQNVPIDFPNDPSDLCYSLEQSEDPSIRQQGTMTTRAVSTARLQLTARGFSVRVVPVIPFCNSTPPQQLLEPLEMTMIVCFEGEPPESPESNLIKIVLFVSMQIHRLVVNCDLDIIAGATSTLLRHMNVVQKTAEAVERLRTPLPPSDRISDPAYLTSDHSGTRMRKNLKNRRVLVRRQFARSRETGGLSVSTCIQMAEFGFTFWRQNVPLTSRFRASLSRDEGVQVDDTSIALMKLLVLETKGIEIGAEWTVQMSNRRVVLKGCLSALKMGVCDFKAERLKCLAKERDESKVAGEEATASKPQQEPCSVGHTLIELLTFGAHAHAHRSYAEVAGSHNDILLRAEQRMNSTQSMSLACEVGPPGVVYLRAGEIETLCLLLIEALLMPTGIQASRLKTNGRRSRGIAFPDRSIGALFLWLARESFHNSAVDKEDISPLSPTESDDTDEVDDLVRSLLESYLPEKTHTVVMRLMVIDVLVFVPEKIPDLETIDESRWLGLVVHQTALVGGFFSEKRTQGSDDCILAILASHGRTWSSFFDAQDNGIHVLVQAWPSLYAAERKNSMCVTTDSLVSDFEISCSYRPSGVALSMGDTTLLVKNLDDLNHLYSSLLAVEDRGRLTMSTIHAVVSCLTNQTRPQRVEKIDVESGMSGELAPPRNESSIGDGDEGRLPIVSRVIESSSGADGSFRLLKKSFGRLREVSEVHSIQLRDVLEGQQRNIDTLRYEIFSKERDRVAALALVSSQATGWLRMGGTHTYGQRVPGVTTMWRYYAVLHNSLLILYTSPGQAKPIDIVVLDGARLFPLAGGRRKRDVQRGFSIIESGGVVRFFMAEGGPEYELWIREIHATINSGTGDWVSQVLGEDKSIDPSSGSLQDESGGNVPADIDGSFEIDEISFDGTKSTTPQRSAQLRSRLSVVSSATKSKLGSATSSTKNILGSAVQAARQRNVSNIGDNRHNTSVNRNKPSDEAGSVSHTQTIGTSTSFPDSVSYQHESVSFRGQDADSVGSIETNESLPRNSKFASVRAGTKNRFGSAFQAAKEKGHAVAEQRRRRLQQRGNPIASPARSPIVPVADDLVAGQTILESKHTELHLGANQLFGSAVTAPIAATPTELGASGNTNRFQQVTEPNAEMRTIAEHKSLENADSRSVGSDDIQSEFLQSDPSLVSVNEMAISGSARRFQLKDKFGAAVKSVRRSTPQENSSAADDDNAGRFSLRRRSVGGEMHESSGAMKLRGIHVGSGNPADELRDSYAPDMDLQLRKIEGCWVTKVETCEVASRLSPHLRTEDNVKESQALSILEVSNTNESVGESQVASTFDEGLQDDVGASNGREYMPSDRDSVVWTNGAQSPPSLSGHVGLQQEDGEATSGGDSTHPNRDNVVGTEDAQSLKPLSKRQVNLQREFRIHVFPNNGGARNAEEDCWCATEVVRSVSDVLALHATISACVSCLASIINAETPGSADHESSKSGSSLIPQGNMIALDGVLLSGKLLVGLVESGLTEIEDTTQYNEYRCELLKKFLNFTLECPLPQNAIQNVSRFLERPDIIGGSVAYEPSSLSRDPASPVMGVAGPVVKPLIASMQKMLACTVSCDNDLVRAETQGRYVQRLIEGYHTERSRSKAASLFLKPEAIPTPVFIRTTSQPFLEPLLPSEITENLHEAMHSALMNVMTERDESHAQLIAASVLHMHEMERERKKVNNLTEQLAATQRLMSAQQNVGGNAFFADKKPMVQENDDMKGKISKIQEKMIQNSEEEMLALCQQLAGEISAKTSASLEIIRLKESRNIERENERAEKEALKNELKRYKELLAAEELKAKEAKLEALAWKQTCEEAAKTVRGDRPT